MDVNAIAKRARRLCDDDQSIPLTDIQDWIDLAIDQINQALKCNIDKISGKAATTIPAFDARFHEVLINYCVIKYREGDSDYQAASYFQDKFDNMVKVMQRDMEVNPSAMVSNEYLQLKATEDNQSLFDLTIPSGSYFDPITVYLNDVDITKYCTINSPAQTLFIDIANVTVVTDDKVTVKFENNSDLNNPPYQWWGNSGW